jgi:hypothetical protein
VKADGFKYYKYALCYVDSALCISTDPKKSRQRVQEAFRLKDGKIAEPDVYLGTTRGKMSLDNGKTCWTMLPEQYKGGCHQCRGGLGQAWHKTVIQVHDTLLLQLRSMAGRDT